MSDDQDKSQKTEAPTSKRLEDAYKKGNVPKSQETNHWFMLAGSGLMILIFSGQVAQGLQPGLMQFLQSPHLIPVGVDEMVAMFHDVGFTLLKLLFLPMLILVIAAIAGNIVQHRLIIAYEKIKPELKKISPISGAKRIFGLQGALNLLKSLLKILIVGGVVFTVVRPDLERLPLFAGMDLLDLILLVRWEALMMLVGVLSVMTVIAVGDYVYQRYDWMENLKMSRQDIKDEHKQSEGDPQVKARIQQVRMERARQRIAAAVPTADVVITNPTHFAVALKYEAETMDAPCVVAKGADNLAFKIREIADEHDVPILENPPLARGLYDSVEIDQEIPPEYYKAVAEVIGYIMNINGRLGSRRPNPRVSTLQ
jgi:flagellar biosynthetic protein FlhB